jgi:DNA-binding transcriptional LysR family regulator
MGAGMEIRLLRSFQVLAQQGHFGRAARALHVSQPALTKQMRQLEDEIGGPLFVRGRHGAQLTSAGTLFREEVDRLLLQADRVLDRAQRAARGEVGELRLGFGVTTRLLVPRLVSRFRKLHPQVHVSLEDMSSPLQLEALEAGDLHIGFVRLPVDRPLKVIPVVEDRLVLAVPEARRADLQRRMPQGLRNEPFVELTTSPPGSPSFQAHVHRVCARYGFRPRVVQQAGDFVTMLALVAAGLGLAVVPRAATATRVEGVVHLPLEVEEARWRVGAAWVADGKNPVRDSFVAVLREELARMPPAARAGLAGKGG